MRLSEFIDTARERIIEESVKYAAELPVLSEQGLETLRDHLPLVLKAISRDLEKSQTRAESVAKSEGKGPGSAEETAAETHGLLRARSGLTIEQLVAEYRVLRSCVLRLWTEAHEPNRETIEDTMRFNEAIDQAVAESVTFFNAELQRWRSIFLGVLGHDLRGPLNAMLLTAELLVQSPHRTDIVDRARTVVRNGHHMRRLLDLLLDYSKSELGIGMILHRVQENLGDQCRDEAEMLRAALPNSNIAFEVRGECIGSFDAVRVREALANLVFNAAQHGLEGGTIAITVAGGEHQVEVRVENDCGPIADDVLEQVFEPLRRHSTSTSDVARNLGLGLFVVREIATTHGGEANAVMDGPRVRFSMRLPKAATA